MVIVRFSKDKNLDSAMKQLIEWRILEYVEAGDSYQATEAFREFVKRCMINGRLILIRFHSRKKEIAVIAYTISLLI